MAVRTFDLPSTETRHFCVDTALSIAWWTWCALLALPCVLFLAVVWTLMDLESTTTAADQHLSHVWFIVVMAYMAIGVPAAFFWRSRMFRGYWAGDIVSPKDYLMGMVTIWIALEIGGVMALLGCIVSGTLLPNLLPALLAFMLFTPLWPNGHSMTRPLHNERDPADYEDPR
jgi:hypothetical protein